MSEPATAQQERDARIAALRTRRRARARWLATRSAIVMVALSVLAVLLLYFLFNTLRGRDVLLGQIVDRLPEGDALTWARAEGPAAGPMILHDLRYVHRGCPDVEGKPVVWPDCRIPLITTFTAKRVMLDPTLRPLLGRRLRLEALSVSGATLLLPESDEPFELPRWPESLPAIAPPLALDAETVEIDDLRVLRATAPQPESIVHLRRMRGGIVAEDGRLHLERIVADSDRGRFTVHGDYAPRDRYRMHVTASAVLPAAAGRTPARLGLAARGDLRKLDIALAGSAPAPLKARLQLEGEAQPRWRFEANSDAVTIAALLGNDDDSAPYAFDLRADGIGGQASVQGRVAQGQPSQEEFVAKILPSKVSIEGQVLLLSPLSLELLGGTVAANGRADFNTPADARFDGTLQARKLRWQGDTKDAVAVDSVAVIGDGDFKVAGRLRDWTVQGDATLLRGNERAAVSLKARGDDKTAHVDTLRATMPTGRLDGGGQLWWTPTLRWQADARLAGFDPGYVLPDVCVPLEIRAAMAASMCASTRATSAVACAGVP
jgi:translocation and assembly module TamB